MGFCGWLQECEANLDDDDEISGSGGLKAKDFGLFIEALTSSQDYDTFLRVMFAEVQRQQMMQAPPQEPDAPQTQEIEVAVPDGMGPGQVMAVDYLGCRYELMIP